MCGERDNGIGKAVAYKKCNINYYKLIDRPSSQSYNQLVHQYRSCNKIMY